MNELWSHVHGMKRIRYPSIATSVMPQIMAWLGNIPIPKDECDVIVQILQHGLEIDLFPDMNAMSLDWVFSIALLGQGLICLVKE